MSLAAQKFVSDVAHDALQIHKRKRAAPQQRLKDEGYSVKDKRLVLTTEDLSDALQEVGGV